MKPRNSRERAVVESASTLPPLTKRHRSYMQDRLPHYLLYKKGGQCKCTDCGHEWKMMPGIIRYWSTLVCTLDINSERECCPQCDNELVPKYYREYYYYADSITMQAVTAHDGYEVLRYARLRRWIQWGKATRYAFDELYQQWIDAQGREVIMTTPYNRSPYTLTWHHGRPMTVGAHNDSCTGAYAWNDMFSGQADITYPRRRHIGTLRRNGWASVIGRQSAEVIYESVKGLLNDSFLETLAKTGHWQAFFWCVMYPDRMRPLRPQVMICVRHGYIVKDMDLWVDMLQALSFFDKDLRNPYYICPPDLKSAHDRWTRKQEQEQRRRERLESARKDRVYYKTRDVFKGLEATEPFLIRPLLTATELQEEGKAMHHCVGTYADKSYDLILSVRDTEGHRLETVEVDLKRYSIVQSRGLQNGFTPEHDRIIAAVKTMLPDIRRMNESARL